MQDKLIKFTGYYQPYNEGETAGFPPHVAAKLVDKGIAEYVEPEGGPEQNRATTETSIKPAPKKTARKKSTKSTK